MTPLQTSAQSVLDRFESVRYANLITPQVIESQMLDLSKALADEQAQAVEPVGKVSAHRGSVAIEWTGKCPSVGTPLFTHPDQPATPLFAGLIAAHDGLEGELLSAKPITGPCGQCKSSADPCYCGNVNTGERAELVHALRSRHLKIDTRAEMRKAADMLEADAQELTRLADRLADQKTISSNWKARALKAQQVAAPPAKAQL